jgi:hypothetical protein
LSSLLERFSHGLGRCGVVWCREIRKERFIQILLVIVI